MNADQLPALMQGLPQEIFDNIYQLVFTASCEPRQIDKHYRPPVQLQVDTASREIFATKYYGIGSTFVIDERIQLRWARSLRAVHFDKIMRIRYLRVVNSLAPSDHQSCRMARKREPSYLVELMECFGFWRPRAACVILEGHVLVFQRKGGEYGRGLRRRWRVKDESKGALFQRL